MHTTCEASDLVMCAQVPAAMTPRTSTSRYHCRPMFGEMSSTCRCQRLGIGSSTVQSQVSGSACRVPGSTHLALKSMPVILEQSTLPSVRQHEGLCSAAITATMSGREQCWSHQALTRSKEPRLACAQCRASRGRSIRSSIAARRAGQSSQLAHPTDTSLRVRIYLVCYKRYLLSLSCKMLHNHGSPVTSVSQAVMLGYRRARECTCSRRR